MKIFISYRRDDSAGYAGRLHDYLVPRFGEKNIFMDIATIEPGEDFREAIRRAISVCDVVLVMIGKQWLSIPDAQGQPRLNNPDDLVRLEVATALTIHKVRVIPVLVRDSKMPGSHMLPDDLKALSWRNAYELSDSRFQYDADELIHAIKRIQKDKPAPDAGLFRKLFYGAVLFALLISMAIFGIPVLQAALLAPTAPTLTMTHTATDAPTSTATAVSTPSETPTPLVLSPAIKTMDQYYKYINNAGTKDDLQRAWDVLSTRYRCDLHTNCKFAEYGDWWWTRKVHYKLYDCGSMVIEAELAYYYRDPQRVITPVPPTYVKYWLVNDGGYLKIDGGQIIKEPDCTEVVSSQ
jgi:hypothetical protein